MLKNRSHRDRESTSQTEILLFQASFKKIETAKKIEARSRERANYLR